MQIRITAAGIAKLIDDQPANLVNRRSKKMLDLGRKEGGEFVYTLTDAVQMVIIKSLTGFIEMAAAHHIGQDPELRFVLENLEEAPFTDLDRIQLAVAQPAPMSRKEGEVRFDSFLFAGRANEAPAFNWSGLIKQTKGTVTKVFNGGLKRHDSNLTDLLPPIMLTFDLRSLTHDVRTAVVKMLPQSFG